MQGTCIRPARAMNQFRGHQNELKQKSLSQLGWSLRRDCPREAMTRGHPAGHTKGAFTTSHKVNPWLTTDQGESVLGRRPCGQDLVQGRQLGCGSCLPSCISVAPPCSSLAFSACVPLLSPHICCLMYVAGSLPSRWRAKLPVLNHRQPLV